MPKLTYKAFPDIGLIEIFVDGEEFTAWSYEDDPEDAFNEFKRVFEKGQEESFNKDIQLLREALKATVKQLNEVTPLLQTAEDGLGPDCAAHFQSLIDANHALEETAVREKISQAVVNAVNAK